MRGRLRTARAGPPETPAPGSERPAEPPREPHRTATGAGAPPGNRAGATPDAEERAYPPAARPGAPGGAGAADQGEAGGSSGADEPYERTSVARSVPMEPVRRRKVSAPGPEAVLGSRAPPAPSSPGRPAPRRLPRRAAPAPETRLPELPPEPRVPEGHVPEGRAQGASESRADSAHAPEAGKAAPGHPHQSHAGFRQRYGAPHRLGAVPRSAEQPPSESPPKPPAPRPPTRQPSSGARHHPRASNPHAAPRPPPAPPHPTEPRPAPPSAPGVASLPTPPPAQPFAPEPASGTNLSQADLAFSASRSRPQPCPSDVQSRVSLRRSNGAPPSASPRPPKCLPSEPRLSTTSYRSPRPTVQHPMYRDLPSRNSPRPRARESAPSPDQPSAGHGRTGRSPPGAGSASGAQWRPVALRHCCLPGPDADPASGAGSPG
jgi:hypothetical protein